MTDKRLDDLISGWLTETAPHGLPERVLDATFDRTRTSRQLVGWRARLGRLRVTHVVPALGGAAVVLIAASLAFGTLASGPARLEGIFADVGGTPKAWSPDGSKLLVLRAVKDSDQAAINQWALFVVHADGTETRLANAMYRSGGDFTPDGSQVVYSGDGIRMIDADGGTPVLLLPSGYVPTLSPDGTRIAYFDGSGDSGHSLRVMNSDGTGVRVVLENDITMGAGHVDGLDWSPDGERLLFAIDTQGVFVVGIDGSGLREVTSLLSQSDDPHWSPDGSIVSGLPYPS